MLARLRALLERLLAWLRAFEEPPAPKASAEDPDAPRAGAGSADAIFEALIADAPPQGLGDRAGAPSAKAWKQALLEDAGVLEHGTGKLRMAERPDPTTEGPGWGPGELYTAPLGPGSIAGRSGDGPLAPGERLWIRELVGRPTAVELEALRNYIPGAPLPGQPTYRALLHAAYDHHKLHLLQRLAEEPLFAYACRTWVPGPTRLDANLEIVHAVYERFGKLMGTIYDFEPSPLAYRPAMPVGLVALYEGHSHQMLIARHHLGGSLADLMDSMAHQQIHCLQHARVAHLRAPDPEHPLSPEEQSLALSWQAEMPRWRGNCRALGLGYHAYDLGRTIGKLFRQLTLEGRTTTHDT